MEAMGRRHSLLLEEPMKAENIPEDESVQVSGVWPAKETSG